MREFSVFAVGRSLLVRWCVFVLVGAGLLGCGTQVGKDFNQSTRGIVGLLTGQSNLEQDDDGIVADPNAPPPPRAVICPKIFIREGTGTYPVYMRGSEQDPSALRYQGGINKVARECTFHSDAQLTYDFGVTGRVLVGPAGAEGTVTLPLRAAFVGKNGAAWTQLYNIQVTIQPGGLKTDFIHVEENFVFDVPEGEHINDYIMYVGFD